MSFQGVYEVPEIVWKIWFACLFFLGERVQSFHETLTLSPEP